MLVFACFWFCLWCLAACGVGIILDFVIFGFLMFSGIWVCRVACGFGICVWLLWFWFSTYFWILTFSVFPCCFMGELCLCVLGLLLVCDLEGLV